MNKHLTLLSAALSLILMASAPAAPLSVGQMVPDTKLRTEGGEVVALRELVSAEPTVLVFYRGGWCPYCNKHLAALAAIEPEILASGHQIVAVSPDQPSALAATPDRASLGYTLLSDSTAETARAFGLAFEVPAELVAKYKSEYQIDLEAASGSTHHQLPHPAIFVIGTDGRIRFAYVNEDYKVRLEPDKVLDAVRQSQP